MALAVTQNLNELAPPVQRAGSYPRHGWTIRVHYGLIHLKVILPDL